jgi:hypothetical protein
MLLLRVTFLFLSIGLVLVACQNKYDNEYVKNIFTSDLKENSWSLIANEISAVIDEDVNDIELEGLTIKWNNGKLYDAHFTIRAIDSEVAYSVAYSAERGKTTIKSRGQTEGLDRKINLKALFDLIDQHNETLFVNDDILGLSVTTGNISYRNTGEMKDRLYKLNQERFVPFEQNEKIAIHGKNVVFVLNERLIILYEFSDVVE